MPCLVQTYTEAAKQKAAGATDVTTQKLQDLKVGLVGEQGAVSQHVHSPLPVVHLHSSMFHSKKHVHPRPMPLPDCCLRVTSPVTALSSYPVNHTSCVLAGQGRGQDH